MLIVNWLTKRMTTGELGWEARWRCAGAKSAQNLRRGLYRTLVGLSPAECDGAGGEDAVAGRANFAREVYVEVTLE